ncbi:unnamed protein product, partial [Adineta steineri]
MLSLHSCSLLLIIFVWSTVNSHSLSPFDIRIDHHKVDTTRDLIINTPRPQFSWKIPTSNNTSHRNIEQLAYQIQLESTKLSLNDKQFHWDSKRIVSSQSI